MKSTTIRISLEAYRLIRDTVAATGERPGDVVLRVKSCSMKYTLSCP